VGIGLFALSTYVVYVGGDFMAGRFWSLPCLAAVAICTRLPLRRWTGAPQGLALAMALLAWAGDFPTLNRTYYALRFDAPDAGIADYTRGLISNSSLEFAIAHDRPAHDWVQVGLEARKHPETVPVWGGMGFGPYYAGPGVVVIDKYALADGFLSHLPIPNPTDKSWRIGHFERAIPAGYVASVEKRQNLIEDPDLARFYDDILLIERGPIFSRARVGAIWRVWTGAHQAGIQRYVERQRG
jgi:arabinofuranosyltransferase